jgi:hypothetical protein
MGFTPPPEKIIRDTVAAIVTPAFSAATREGRFEGGALAIGGGELAWPALEDGHWTWTREAHVLLSLATYRLLVDGSAQPDGSVLISGQIYWLCDVTLADGTQLAVAVPA